MSKIIYEFISGLVFSIIGFFILIGFHDLLLILKIKLDWSGTGRFFWGMFLGLPIGSIFGFVLINKLYFKIFILNIYSLIISFIFGIIGGIILIILHDYLNFGQSLFIIMPILITLMCLCGYRVGLFLKLPK